MEISRVNVTFLSVNPLSSWLSDASGFGAPFSLKGSDRELVLRRVPGRGGAFSREATKSNLQRESASWSGALDENFFFLQNASREGADCCCCLLNLIRKIKNTVIGTQAYESNYDVGKKNNLRTSSRLFAFACQAPPPQKKRNE